MNQSVLVRMMGAVKGGAIFRICVAVMAVAVSGVMMAEAKSPRYSSTEKLRTEIDTITLADVLVKATPNPVGFEVFPNLKAAKKAFRRPEFPGGDIRFARLLIDNFRQPTEGLMESMSGHVILRFLVGKNGAIIDADVKGTHIYQLADEIMRSVRLLPHIRPAEFNGRISFAVGRVWIDYSVVMPFSKDEASADTGSDVGGMSTKPKRGLANSMTPVVEFEEPLTIVWEPAQIPFLLGK